MFVPLAEPELALAEGVFEEGYDTSDDEAVDDGPYDDEVEQTATSSTPPGTPRESGTIILKITQHF
jgi:hypothetical protein